LWSQQNFFHDNSGVVTDGFQYVPILPDVGKQLSHDDVYEHTAELKLTVSAETKSTIELYTDSSKFANDPFFAANPDALHIQLYADGLEVCNPLGAIRANRKSQQGTT
jgi:hypothetical protein